MSHVNGKSYEVISPNLAYEDTGKASWYGPGFHGRKTAITTIFDENKLSAASRVYPLPSVVNVIVRDSRGVCRRGVLPVTDRGPYTNDPDRIIDLSPAAAEKFGFIRQGIADVYTRMDPEKTRIALGQSDIDPSLPETNTTLKLD
jgi:rare lipoprotein A